MHKYKLVIDQHFYSLILPIVKDLTKKYDRECSEYLGQIIEYCGRLQIQDKELWDILRSKLTKEKLWRYMHVSQLILMSEALLLVDQGEDAFYCAVQKEALKHRLALLEEDIEVLKRINANKKFYSQEIECLINDLTQQKNKKEIKP